jgi:hypothetical protein
MTAFGTDCRASAPAEYQAAIKSSAGRRKGIFLFGEGARFSATLTDSRRQIGLDLRASKIDRREMEMGALRAEVAVLRTLSSGDFSASAR